MATRRELIEPQKGDKRYVRRNKKGRFKESEDVGRWLRQDRRRKAKNVAPEARVTVATAASAGEASFLRRF